MTDDYRDNFSSHSIDVIKRRPNKNLEIILEENNSYNHDNNAEISESKTQENFFINNSPLHETSSGKRYNSSEKRRRNERLHKKVKQILDYRAKLNSIKPEEDSLEIKNEENNNKKKVPKKVNRNLKLLNLIKERMNQAENKDDKKELKIEEKKENTAPIEENKNIEKDKNVEENKEIKKEEKEGGISSPGTEKKGEIENKKELEGNNNTIDKEDERRQKLMKLLDKKRYTKRPKRENEFEKKEEKNKITIPHPQKNVGSVSYPTFMKKGVGNFRINTPKSKQNKPKEEKEDEKIKIENNKEEKSSDIPIEQKNRLTINITPNKSPSLLEDNINPAIEDKNFYNQEIISDNKKKIDLNDKKEDDNLLKEDKEDNNVYETNRIEEKNTDNKSNDNSSSKKGAMKILELLKAKKKEQNENTVKTPTEDKLKNETKIKKQEEEEDEDDEKIIIDNQNKKEIGSPCIYNQRKTEGDGRKNVRNSSEGKFDINSLPKKIFRDEEDEEDNNLYDSHNRTLQQFKNNKKTNYNKIKVNENMNKKRHYINNINNINNNINNFFNLNNPPNYQERKTVNYINNANKLRNRYNKNVNNYNSLNQTEKNTPKSYFDPKNSFINKNMKTLDNSFDLVNSRKNFMPKRIANNNFNSINVNSNKNIYAPKKISNKNSPIRYIPPQRNTINNLNSTKNLRNEKLYNKLNNIRNSAYVKKSPGRFKEPKNSNNNLGENKKIIRNIYNMSNKNNIMKNKAKIYTNVDNPNNNIGSFEVSSIYGLNSSTDSYSTNRFDYINTYYNNYYNKNNSIENDKKGASIIFNLEDLMVLEERLNDINFALESNKNIERQCLNFFNYYYNCSLYQILEKVFPNEEDSNAIRLSINYELMSIIVCYEYSFQIDVYDEDLCLSLLELIFFNHNNLMIICEYILKKIAPENKGNVWALKLQEIVNNAKLSQNKELKNNYSSSPVNKIKNNTKTLINKLKNILSNYKTEFSQIIFNYLKNIEFTSYEEINDFFRNFILRENNFEGSIMASSYLKKIKNFKPLPAPYITEPSTKPYTLILDLDETLVSFKIKSKKEGTLRARPFLFGFLEEMGHYFELIVWTSATEAYANSLIDAIEIEKQYFDYVLFREHAIIIGDDFVKDLNRVGRSLDRVIIVDDMPQNFRLQKKNGITIKPFLGDDFNDTALYDLIPILKHIAEEGNDVRIGLEKYRDEIVRKVTSNISKQNY